MFALSKFLFLCPAEAVNFVQLKNPQTTVEAANLVLRRQGKDRRPTYRPWSRGCYGRDSTEEKKRPDGSQGTGSQDGLRGSGEHYKGSSGRQGNAGYYRAIRGDDV